MIPLTELGKGNLGVIVQIRGGHGFHRKMACLGLRVGKTVRNMTAIRGGPIVIEVEGTQIAIGRGMASKVLVEAI